MQKRKIFKKNSPFEEPNFFSSGGGISFSAGCEAPAVKTADFDAGSSLTGEAVKPGPRHRGSGLPGPVEGIYGLTSTSNRTTMAGSKL